MKKIENSIEDFIEEAGYGYCNANGKADRPSKYNINEIKHYASVEKCRKRSIR